MGLEKDQKVKRFVNSKKEVMQKSESMQVRIKACGARFKAGSELSAKVNLVELNIEQVDNPETEKSCLDVDFKWDQEAELLDSCQE